jgi:hypothetical protein
MSRLLIHAHSTWSHDGKIPLEQWSQLAEEHGFDAVLLSEHEESGWTARKYADYREACNESSSARVTLVPGLEFNQDGYHILCYGLRDLPSRPSAIEQLSGEVRDQGCQLCLAHPGKYRWHYPTELVKAVDAVEVWNSKWIYDGLWGPHPKSLRLAGGKAFLVGQDVHKPKHLTALRIDTDSADFLADLTAGHYRIVCGTRRFHVNDLRDTSTAGLIQQARTTVLRSALSVYRATRPLRKTLAGSTTG